ncbi:MAG: hypothetical protein ACO1N0_18950 [Fluviicola sp.]
MKKIIFLSLITLSGFSFAQKGGSKVEVNTGKPYEVVDAASKQYVTLPNGNVLSVKTDGIEITLQTFDGNSGDQIKKKMTPALKKGSLLQRIVQTTEGVFYLYEMYNGSIKAFELFSMEIDTEDLTFDKPVSLLQTKRKITKGERDDEGDFPLTWGTAKTGAMEGLVFIGVNFTVYQSYDRSHIMVQYRLKPETKRDAKSYDELGFHVFDKSMNPLWGGEYKMPHTEAEMNNIAYTVTSKGVVYMISYLTSTKELELISVSKEGIATHKLEGTDGSLLFNRMRLIEDVDGDVICSSFYASGLDFKGSFSMGMSATLAFMANGIYGFTISPDFVVSGIYNIEFPQELIKSYLSERQAKKQDASEKKGREGIEDLQMIDFFAQKDGSFIITGEQKYVRNEMYMTGTTNVAHFGSMVVAKISKGGELAWITKLPKNQALVLGDNYNPFSEGQLSYTYINSGSNHYMIFVDNEKNATLGKNEAPAAHKNGMGGYLMAMKVDDKTGEWERIKLADMNDLGGYKAYQFRVTRICKATDNTFLMEIYKKEKQDVMIKFDFE